MPFDVAPLTTPRLTLLPLRVEDAAEMVHVLADHGLHRFIGGAPLKRDELVRRYRRLVRGVSDDGRETWMNWTIRERDGGDAIGTVQATIITDSGVTRASVAWVIGTRWQSRGFASEAASALVTWLVGAGCVVTANVHPNHAASRLVAQRAGLFCTTHTENDEDVWASVPLP